MVVPFWTPITPLTGFLLHADPQLATFTHGGMRVRAAAATKNVLSGVINLTAVLIFLVSGEVRWLAMTVAMAGALAGSWLGTHLLRRVNERALRIGIVVIGLALATALFYKA